MTEATYLIPESTGNKPISFLVQPPVICFLNNVSFLCPVGAVHMNPTRRKQRTREIVLFDGVGFFSADEVLSET